MTTFIALGGRRKCTQCKAISSKSAYLEKHTEIDCPKVIAFPFSKLLFFNLAFKYGVGNFNYWGVWQIPPLLFYLISSQTTIYYSRLTVSYF